MLLDCLYGLVIDMTLHNVKYFGLCRIKPEQTSLYKQVRTNAARSRKKEKVSRHVLTLKFLFQITYISLKLQRADINRFKI